MSRQARDSGESPESSLSGGARQEAAFKMASGVYVYRAPRQESGQE